jgi:hypothetical protein
MNRHPLLKVILLLRIQEVRIAVMIEVMTGMIARIVARMKGVLGATSATANKTIGAMVMMIHSLCMFGLIFAL